MKVRCDTMHGLLSFPKISETKDSMDKKIREYLCKITRLRDPFDVTPLLTLSTLPVLLSQQKTFLDTRAEKLILLLRL